MRKIILSSVIVLTMISCTEHDEVFFEQSVTSTNEQVDLTISLDEAMIISGKLRGQMGYSRSISERIANIDYVVGKQSRANESVDTLAYIINYADDKGFSIIAARSIQNPILAFSEESQFDFSNGTAKEMFVNRIEDYMNSPMYLPGDRPLPDVNPTPIGVVPFSKMKLSQGAPWNKYVAEEYGVSNMPVGCVAVATLVSMAYSKPELTYHDVTYNFKSMVKTIEDKVAGLSVDEELCSLTCDSMAKILYWIGKDLDMSYSVSGSAVATIRAERLLRKLGFEVNASKRYEINDVIDSLDNNYIVILDAKHIDHSGGHAFISDGHTLIGVPNDPPIYTQYGEQLTFCPFLHCDWGWGGFGNGYFRGEVFQVDNDYFEPTRYRTVKREY